ncbi:hypothetical protein AB0N31_02290 [Streptomyces sp. NPDC051051]|uniref:hypothetical protein n=1 Tax=Streptomyces sp. NPDC051051 TaxID=3155666 RepID=UPI003413312E
MTHHKSNRAVEGDPYSGHGGGLPRRPDEEELARRTTLDRQEAGLPEGPAENPDLVYREVHEAVDHAVDNGMIPGATATRRTRED